nr:hypothetical protein [Bacteroidota bacterium]
MKNFYLCLSNIILASLVLLGNAPLSAQFSGELHPRDITKISKQYHKSGQVHVSTTQKKPGHYTREDWAEAIDATWGEGLPTAEKLLIFDKAIDTLDREFGAYFNVNINLDSVIALYRPEIENGVSRGRFAAIMNYISLYMQDTHTMLMDMPVNWGTEWNPGVPLFVIGGFASNAHFGACLTPLPDSSLLVYRALDNHQLGIETGDIVLGYDGIPWKILYRELMDAQLPIYTSWVWGSTTASISHQILMSAGMNWHLFDTIDIVKYGTGETLHLATSPLSQQNGYIWGNEQLPVPGIEQPDFINEEYVKWGIVEGTNIGYLYIASYDGNPQLGIFESIYEAVYDFMYTWETSGFIIDYRINYGGTIDFEYLIYKLLFNETLLTIGYDVRSDPANHFGMSPSSWATPFWLRIPGNPNSYYDKPIAILTGPGTVSAGDVESVRMSFHPMARFFGKPGAGALTISRYPDLGHPDWFFYMANGTAYYVSNHEYLCHTGVAVDEEVWLTQDGVVSDTDDVVESAINWINGATGIDENRDVQQKSNPQIQIHPNPFYNSTIFEYEITQESENLIKVHDLLGQEIKILAMGFSRQVNIR